MTDKVVIDEAMVERAHAGANRLCFGGQFISKTRARNALEAALNPPQEPEIVVTEKKRRERRTHEELRVSARTKTLAWDWTLRMWRIDRRASTISAATRHEARDPRAEFVRKVEQLVREAQPLPIKYQRTCNGSHLVENERKGERRCGMDMGWGMRAGRPTQVEKARTLYTYGRRWSDKSL